MLLDDVARDGEPKAGATCLTTNTGPVDLVEPFEDPGLRRPRDPDPVIGDGADERPRSSATETVTSPPSGLNFTALWSRLTKTCAEPGCVAEDGWAGARHIDPERHALAVGEEPQPFGRLGRDLAHITRSTAEGPAALDPRQVEQLADHLDQVAGLDFDLSDPVAHLGRDR